MAQKGVSFKIDQKSFVDLQNKLKKVGLNGKQVAGQAMYTLATHIGNESQALVPVDTGVLRGSMDITRQKSFTQKTVRAEITYGGPSAPYAIVQHERTEFNHPKGGEAKFLEKPFLKHTEGFPQSFVERMEAEAGFTTWTGGTY